MPDALSQSAAVLFDAVVCHVTTAIHGFLVKEYGGQSRNTAGCTELSLTFSLQSELYIH